MTSEEAIKFIKAHKKELLSYFITKQIVTPEEDPILICMAGSSGAGKTETAEGLMSNFLANSIVRIDADEVKQWIVNKCGGDVNNYHSAGVTGMEKIYDECLKLKKNCILDGTFSDLEKSINNIERAINPKRGYTVVIVYVYQDPEYAWGFINKRLLKQGRAVRFETFKRTFYDSISNVCKVKEIYGSRVMVYGVKKNYDFSKESYKINADLQYLQKILKDVSLTQIDKYE